MDDGSLRVETLGPLTAYAQGRELALGPPKQRAVFAVLALNANVVAARDDLIDQIWGESSPATAVGSLHTYVSGLRRVLAGLGDPLTSSGSGYLLRLDPVRVDVGLVERLAARARANSSRCDPISAVTALDEALACWRPGSPLGGLPGPFVAEHRARVSDLRLRLLTERAELLLDLGQPDDVVAQLSGQVQANPYHERLRALLITALHHSGRTADALREYQALRQLLAEDLGIGPSAELQALYVSMLADDPATCPASARTSLQDAAAAPLRPAQLPRDVGCFIGRAASVLQVLSASATEDGADATAPGIGSPRIVMIVGVGGIGKTALAVRCGRLLSAGYPDGQLYVNLRGFDPKHPALSPAEALHQLLASLNVRMIPAGHDQRVALWRSTVRDKSLFIVFDNAESADQIEDLLPGGGPSFVVVTSRNRLSAVAVRHAARRITLSPLTADESVELLSGAIGSARVDAERPTVRRLAALCDHLPLALRIASEQLTARPHARVADLVADLEDAQRRLDALQIPDDELCSMRAVLSCSYARLDAGAAHAFRTLGLFPGVSIVPEAATALFDLPLPAATTALQHLAAQHLVEASGSRYRMHDLTRIYAEELSHSAEMTGSRQPALERVLRWYIQTLTPDCASSGTELPCTSALEACHAPLRFGTREESVAWCVREWGNLAPLVRTAHRTGRHEQAWQLVYLLFDYFYAAGQPWDWVETLRIGLRSAEAIKDRRAQALLLNQLNLACSRLSQHSPAARPYAQDALEALEALERARRGEPEYRTDGCLDDRREPHAQPGGLGEAADGTDFPSVLERSPLTSPVS
ncbi:MULTISPECIES: BTAD domain-containing putative transcriptional regulator [unclassified Frankia]|uniref:AfsR/SARP family transcriptional regulator n=1 Tax=unclassified Frankia TaxID=2632575 RepID=UPI001EF6C9A2|nr:MULTISPECIES: BTAD domain-containing putative transcriptional regulator [unclassified Frankia]